MPQHRSSISSLRRTTLVGVSIVLCVTAAPAALGAAGSALSDRPLHLLVGLPAGGGADAVARVFAEGLARSLGQHVVVENRAGSGGLIAADAVAKSSSDGNTLLFGTVSSMAIFPSLYKKLPYHAVQDFTPISMIGSYPLVLVVNTSLPSHSMAEFIAYARARPGQLSYASAGHGSPLHLSMEMLKHAVGIDLVHVPYKGGVQATGDLLRGDIQVVFDALPTQLANIRSGRVRALAVSSSMRSAQLPHVPTLTESGIVGMELSGWFAAFAPAGLPADTLHRLHSAMVKVLEDPATRQRLSMMGADAATSTPQQLAEFQQAEIARWRKAVQMTGASVN